MAKADTTSTNDVDKVKKNKNLAKAKLGKPAVKTDIPSGVEDKKADSTANNKYQKLISKKRTISETNDASNEQKAEPG